jgi:hypothetical protein
VPAQVVISRVGDEKDFFIELTNNTSYDTDVSGWILVSNTKSFTLPKNTMIGSKNKIIISAKITNFSIADGTTLKLLTPKREVSFDYSPPILVPVETVSVNPAENKEISSISSHKDTPAKNDTIS